MAAIALVVELKLKPGMREPFLTRVREHRSNVLKNEPGCLRFDLAVPRESDDTVFLYEVYVDEDALETHESTPYMKQYREDVAPMLAERNRRLCGLAND